MSIDANEIAEFKAEALELLEEAEKALLEVEQGQDFKPRYDAIFRSYHSLKGAAGMLELEALRHHMHNIEDLFSKLKEHSSIPQVLCTFFLNAIDAAKSLIEGEEVQFDYSLPTDSPKPAETATEASKNEKIETSTQYDIFIIDDEPDLVEILGLYMTKCNYNWKGFTNPAEAVELFQKHPPKLVISDMKMPQMDGMQVLKSLREVSKAIPLIFISGHLSKELVIEAMENGVSGIVEKPFREAQVVHQVEQSLQRAEMMALLNRTIEILMFQMPDLEQYLIKNNKQNILATLKKDVTMILNKRREMNTKK